MTTEGTLKLKFLYFLLVLFVSFSFPRIDSVKENIKKNRFERLKYRKDLSNTSAV